MVTRGGDDTVKCTFIYNQLSFACLFDEVAMKKLLTLHRFALWILVWDTRNLKHPLSIAEDVASLNSEANVIFSPDERLILTGTGVKKNEGYGKIIMMNSENLDVVRTVSVSQSSVVRVLWHDKLNQVW